jgi:FixJ family two-component response regulator
MENAPIVHLVDDDGDVLKAVGRLLMAAGHACRIYPTAEDFLATHDPDRPGCAIIDLGLPGLDGFCIQERLLASGTGSPVIFLTGIGDIPASVRAMKAGAVDFLTKPVEAEDLLAAVEEALNRDVAFRAARSDRDSLQRRLTSLTPREREVLDLVVMGRLNKQIAADIGAAEKTVKVHRGRMMRKMGVRTVADLVRLVSGDRLP